MGRTNKVEEVKDLGGAAVGRPGRLFGSRMLRTPRGTPLGALLDDPETVEVMPNRVAGYGTTREPASCWSPAALCNG